jgi:hypothetical protein
MSSVRLISAAHGMYDVQEIGGVAVGHNVEVAEGLELINQVFVDIPHDGDDPSFGVITGFIATVPAGRE